MKRVHQPACRDGRRERGSSNLALARGPGEGGAPLGATRSRSASMPKRRPMLAQLLVERPRVGPLGTLVAGDAPFSSMHPVLSPIAAIASSSASSSTGSRGTAASSARLASTGFAAGPASWISVGATHATAGWASVHAARQLQHREPVAVGDRPQLVETRPPRLDPAGRAGSGGGRVSPSRPSSGTSSWNSPP